MKIYWHVLPSYVLLLWRKKIYVDIRLHTFNFLPFYAWYLCHKFSGQLIPSSIPFSVKKMFFLLPIIKHDTFHIETGYTRVLRDRDQHTGCLFMNQWQYFNFFFQFSYLCCTHKKRIVANLNANQNR